MNTFIVYVDVEGEYTTHIKIIADNVELVDDNSYAIMVDSRYIEFESYVEKVVQITNIKGEN